MCEREWEREKERERERATIYVFMTQPSLVIKRISRLLEFVERKRETVFMYL